MSYTLCSWNPPDRVSQSTITVTSAAWPWGAVPAIRATRAKAARWSWRARGSVGQVSGIESWNMPSTVALRRGFDLGAGFGIQLPTEPPHTRLAVQPELQPCSPLLAGEGGEPVVGTSGIDNPTYRHLELVLRLAGRRHRETFVVGGNPFFLLRGQPAGGVDHRVEMATGGVATLHRLSDLGERPARPGPIRQPRRLTETDPVLPRNNVFGEQPRRLFGQNMQPGDHHRLTSIEHAPHRAHRRQLGPTRSHITQRVTQLAGDDGHIHNRHTTLAYSRSQVCFTKILQTE